MVTTYLTNIFTSVPTSVMVTTVIMFIWMFIQQKRDKQSKITTNMVVRNSIFVGLMTGLAVYYATVSRIVDEQIDIGPANF
jgi:undecaprenyl pyrophosphate phosphatase UppP